MGRLEELLLPTTRNICRIPARGAKKILSSATSRPISTREKIVVDTETEAMIVRVDLDPFTTQYRNQERLSDLQ